MWMCGGRKGGRRDRHINQTDQSADDGRFQWYIVRHTAENTCTPLSPFASSPQTTKIKGCWKKYFCCCKPAVKGDSSLHRSVCGCKTVHRVRGCKVDCSCDTRGTAVYQGIVPTGTTAVVGIILHVSTASHHVSRPEGEPERSRLMMTRYTAVATHTSHGFSLNRQQHWPRE